MARAKIGITGGSGQVVKRVLKQRGATVRRSAVRKPTVNTSNTYGITGMQKYDAGSPSGTPGAVTQNKVPNKTYARAKKGIKG